MSIFFFSTRKTYGQILAPNLAERGAKFVSSSLLINYAITSFMHSFVAEKVKIEEIQRTVGV